MLAALLLAAKLAVAHHAPFLVSRAPIEGGERLVVENPLFRAVTVTIHCGGASQYDESEVGVSPRTRQTIDIETEPQATVCYMASWR
jgi:hypothetical protein